MQDFDGSTLKPILELRFESWRIAYFGGVRDERDGRYVTTGPHLGGKVANENFGAPRTGRRQNMQNSEGHRFSHV